MPKLFATTRDGHTLEIDGEEGLSVMEVLREGGVDEILAICGGSCSCATCHVHVDPDFADRIPPPSPDETELLAETSGADATSRLSCQIEFGESLEGLRIRIASEE